MLRPRRGSNSAVKRLMEETCSVNARESTPEVKVRKLEFNKYSDKESLLNELQSLKEAVAYQAYHFLLHKAHLQGLRAKQRSVLFASLNFKIRNIRQLWCMWNSHWL
uniref:Uncharacterized protein n=1 Tax=Physcomitrium patens TaxID=3218 RepID=A0A2K1KIS8_PHYPA|nr:hypothetical protein PHYPA_007356 [Physcomitrium patens]